MKSITVAELRQNPTEALRAPDSGPADLSDLKPWDLTTAGSVDELIDDMKSEW